MKHFLTQSTLSGFTLVETLVAITVLLLVIIGPITIAQKGIQNAYHGSEQISATFLAQEAIEALRNYRDRNALQSFDAYMEQSESIDTDGWIPAACTTNNPCTYDVAGNALTNCGGECSRMRINVDKKYVQVASVGDSESIFRRSVVVGTIVNGGVPVTVTVAWNSRTFGNTERQVVLKTWIYDIYQRYEF